ncbi:uncharacterized protein LOC143259905 [Megalopta genalis]|uniref:uncharacterized protein LOC143259905 n=1 Tax=Megalopta genalis TaxID=115081 RepID=UPI003FD0A602
METTPRGRKLRRDEARICQLSTRRPARMKYVVLLLLVLAMATIVMPRPWRNEASLLQSNKTVESRMAKGYLMREKKHIYRCKTKAHSTSFSLQTRLVNLAFAQSSAYTKHGSHHRLDC